MQSAQLMPEHIASRRNMQGAYPSHMAKERAYRENRRQWLSLWADEVGGPKRLADLTDTVDTHITAVIKGRRNVGDDLAEKLVGASLSDDVKQAGTVNRFLAELDGVSNETAK